MQAEDLKRLESFPPSTTCRRLDFESAQVVPGFVNGTYFLVVSGKKPWASITVDLVPLIYITQPDYWGIEVRGCQTGIGLPMVAPFTAVLEITHVLGKRGIEVLGATNAKQIDVP